MWMSLVWNCSKFYDCRGTYHSESAFQQVDDKISEFWSISFVKTDKGNDIAIKGDYFSLDPRISLISKRLAPSACFLPRCSEQ